MPGDNFVWAVTLTVVGAVIGAFLGYLAGQRRRRRRTAARRPAPDPVVETTVAFGGAAQGLGGSASTREWP